MSAITAYTFICAIPWHKQERENILKACGVKVEYGEPVDMGKYRGTHSTVGDPEHAEIIRLYVEEIPNSGSFNLNPAIPK